MTRLTQAALASQRCATPQPAQNNKVEPTATIARSQNLQVIIPVTGATAPDLLPSAEAGWPEGKAGGCWACLPL